MCCMISEVVGNANKCLAVLRTQGFRPSGGPSYPGMQMRPGGVSGASSYPGAMPAPGPGPIHMPGPPRPAQPMPQQPRPAAQPGSTSAAPNVWTEHTAPDGRKYYYNKALGKSSWDKPAELLSPKVIDVFLQTPL